MAKVLLQYRLKPGTSPEAFEAWVRTTDYPAIRGIARVAEFANHRVRGLLLGEGEPDCHYAEIFDIPDLDGFSDEDIPGPVIQGIMGDFMARVEEPRFLILDEIV